MAGSDDEGGAAFAPILDPVEDDGYVSPDFDLPPASDNEEDGAPPPKRAKSSKSALAEEEEMALQLLRSRR